MEIRCKGKATVKVKATGELLPITPDQVEWDSEGVDMRDMGPETEHRGTATVTDRNDKDYEITWSISEYPAGAENHKETTPDDGLTVVTDFDYGLDHTPD